MSDDQQEWESTVFGVLAHPMEARILLVPNRSGEGWGLPAATLPRRIWFLHLGWVTDLMQAKLGISVTAVRYLELVTDELAQTVEGVYVLENWAGEVGEILGGRWVDRHELRELTLAVPHQRPLLEGYLAEVERGEVPVERPPWARMGWYGEAERWIEDVLPLMESAGLRASA